MVSLAGAGPGDPGLITIKAVERLKTADVVLYDRLANDALLNYCKPEAELFFVGKEAGIHHVKQEDTISMMIDFAKQGKSIVRLKGGDPLIFGRGSEEAIALKEAGIEFEFIPGITAGIGASAYAGIPVTHRNLVTKCIFITAHEDPTKEASQNDWKEIARLTNTTIVIYMGVSNAPAVSEVLIQNGMDASMPVAIIENGTYTNQRTITTTLIGVDEAIKSNNIKPPSLFVISPSVSIKEQIDWFETKPLFGQRIAATRATDQIHSMCSKLEAMGAEVIPFSVISTEIIIQQTKIRTLLERKKYDWLLFTSENGVRYFFELLSMENLDARALGKIKIGVIGKGTASKLQEFKLNADFVPQKYTSEAMLEEMPKTEVPKGKSFLRVKGDFSQDFLTDGLREFGADVDTIDVYKIKKDRPSDSVIKDMIENGCEAVTFTSQSTVNNFIEIFGIENALKIFHQAVPIAIGPVTAEALDQHGITNYRMAKTHTIDGVIENILDMFNEC